MSIDDTPEASVALEIPYYSIDTPDPPSYIRMYKSLLAHAPTLGLNAEAVYLYSLLMDRASLSASSGWYDADGRVYIIYTRESAAAALGCCRTTAVKAYHTLIDAGLIGETHQTNRAGYTVAPHIYIKQWAAPSIVLSVSDIRTGALNSITRTNANILVDDYITVPRDMHYMQLSCRGKILYGLLLDLSQLSRRYGRWDADRRVWCSMDAQEAQALLQCGHTTLSRLYAELISHGLITRVRAECGCAIHTYVHPCWLSPVGRQQSTDNCTT